MVVSRAAADLFAYRLIFIRHGETAWNAEGRLQGQHETHLNGRGRDQAAAAARVLGGCLGPSAAEILGAMPFFASPLLRARQTMEILLRTTGMPLKPFTTDRRLMEISFGLWQGLTWSEVKARAPQGYQARRADRWSFVPPEGESYAMGAARVREWLLTLRGDALVVAHGGVARALMYLLAGVAPAAAAAAPIAQGRVLLFERGKLEWIAG